MVHQSSKMLSVKNLNITFDGEVAFHALKDISFEIDSGVSVGLIGQSGSGKSLISLALMGLLPKAAKISGSIIFENKEILNFSDTDFQNFRGNSIGMIFQEPMSALNPIMKVGNQLLESIFTHNSHYTNDLAKKIAINWLNKVKLPNPEKLFDRYPNELSGGQKQRVMIAMAMCNHPKLLIADEPTTALDVTVQSEIILLMKDLQQEFNTALLFISHDLALTKKVVDRYLILKNGEFIEKMDLPPKMQTTENQLFSNIIIDVKDLVIAYPGKKNILGKITEYLPAVDKINFQIYENEILGLVGESGCGKSTVSKALLGLVKPNEGEIWYKNEKIIFDNKKKWKSLRKNIQIIFQDPYSSLNPRMSIGDILSEPLIIHKLCEPKKLKDKVLELLSKVELPASAFDKYPHEFSGGQRQRICIARALAVKPDFIICDESVAALDVNIQFQILELLKSLQLSENLTFLFISHDLKIVASFCHRIMVMQAGKIVEIGTPVEIFETPKNVYTKKLVDSIP